MGEVHLPPHVVANPMNAMADESALFYANTTGGQDENPSDACFFEEEWLPITESRNGSVITVACHLLCSGIGIQALGLPLAFAILGWGWGMTCFTLGFAWQLYTKWILVQLHEGANGSRCSRYLHLSITAFGPRLGKLLAIFPVVSLSGGTCTLMTIIGGRAMHILFKTICTGYHARSPSIVESSLVFACLAVVIAQLPNLNSLAPVSLVGAITAVGYSGLIVGLSISQGRPDGVSYKPLARVESNVDGVRDILHAIGIIALVFRGSNLILEIQGTLPSNSRNPSRKSMWRATACSYFLIGLCYCFLAIGGFWSYGNKIQNGGLLTSFPKFHAHRTPKLVMGLLYLLIVINCLCTFQIFAMPVFDNLEIRYMTIWSRRCSRRARTLLRIFFCGVMFFVSIALPFMPKLVLLIGAIASPLTYALPCFMWMALRRPRRWSGMWWLNLWLGLSAAVLLVVMLVGASWTLADHGLHANFFNP